MSKPSPLGALRARAGLQPGETSKPVKLLSWTIDFRVAAQDYRYDFGDGTTSGWTTSTGGTYPDGDVTHTYKNTGDMDVKVDARLTGQYRVNGGPVRRAPIGEWKGGERYGDERDRYYAELRGEVTGTRPVRGRPWGSDLPARPRCASGRRGGAGRADLRLVRAGLRPVRPAHHRARGAAGEGRPVVAGERGRCVQPLQRRPRAPGPESGPCSSRS